MYKHPTVLLRRESSKQRKTRSESFHSRPNKGESRAELQFPLSHTLLHAVKETFHSKHHQRTTDGEDPGGAQEGPERNTVMLL